MRFRVARQIADRVARADGMALVAMMQRAGAGHHHEDFLLEDMAMAARRPMTGADGLDGKADRGAAERAADVGHAGRNRRLEAIVEGGNVPDVDLAKGHGRPRACSGLCTRTADGPLQPCPAHDSSSGRSSNGKPGSSASMTGAKLRRWCSVGPSRLSAARCSALL